ncbi:Baseplate J family protein [Paraburkholderia bonniea]|uniref:Baseplate J family protein n=1 Tax=Paraburkholderia bonniea TaxID=2152891 RepID=UPI001290942A|nr:Baseplate J family protein [Paraburkholderia bonniea]
MTLSPCSRALCGRAPGLVHSGRVAALDSGSVDASQCAQRMARVTRCTLPGLLPPVPPANKNGWATAITGKSGGLAGGFCQWQRAGSTNNTWFLLVVAAKSLILERSADMSWALFAINRAVFAASRVFCIFRVLSLSSLSNLLKKKKKEGDEEAKTDPIPMPSIVNFLPSVSEAAYFLGHELHRSEWPDSWQLMENKFNKIKCLCLPHRQATRPRVALCVVRRSAPRRAG